MRPSWPASAEKESANSVYTLGATDLAVPAQPSIQSSQVGDLPAVGDIIPDQLSQRRGHTEVSYQCFRWESPPVGRGPPW